MAHAERREKFAAREGKHVGGIATGRVADQMRENQDVAVVIVPRGARRGLERHAFGIGGHIAFHELHAIDRLEGGAERSLQRASEGKASGMTQQLIDGDGMPRVIRVLPGGDRHGPIELQLALAHQHADQRRGHRFRHGEAEQRRLRSNAVRIALRDDAAGLHDDDGAGVPVGRLRGFSEGAVECGGQLRSLRRHDRRAGDLRQDRGVPVIRGRRDVGKRRAMIERAAEPLAIDGMAAADAEQRHGDVLARAIDLVVHRPGDQAGAGHRIGGLAEIAPGIEV